MAFPLIRVLQWSFLRRADWASVSYLDPFWIRIRRSSESVFGIRIRILALKKTSTNFKLPNTVVGNCQITEELYLNWRYVFKLALFITLRCFSFKSTLLLTVQQLIDCYSYITQGSLESYQAILHTLASPKFFLTVQQLIDWLFIYNLIREVGKPPDYTAHLSKFQS